MRVPLSWLREHAPVPVGEPGRAVAERLIRAGLEVETVDVVGGGTTGPLVVGRVLAVELLEGFKKPIRFCQVQVGEAHGGMRGIVCGAPNVAEGQLVVVALPGAILPGGFAIAARETYGRTSDGMICSERELGLGESHDGILELDADSGQPGDPAAPVLGLGEEVLDIAVTPDRGYCLSVRGVAREAATAYRVAFDDPAAVVVPPVGSGGPEARVLDTSACDRFTLRALTGFDPAAPTPGWMRRRLVQAGMRSVNLAVDVTNYVMLELGQPLHAFDAAKLRGPVQVRRAAAGETLETLDHVVRTLHPEDLVIADDRGPIGLAGTMGGLDTEVDATTTTIVLEAAHFDDVVVARMARRHKVSSEASRRFERGVDHDLPAAASARAAALLAELGGAAVGAFTVVDHPLVGEAITLAPDLPSRVAGIPVPVEEVVASLAAIGATAVPQGALLHVAPPSWRPDLTDPADLVEEVLRLRGYDTVPATLPRARSGRGLTREQRLRRRLGAALTGLGLVEVLSSPFVGEPELAATGLSEADPRRRALRLANPMSAQQPLLRTTLLPGLFAAARRNLGRGQDDLALVESGPVYLLRPGQSPDGPVDPPRPGVAGPPSLTELAALEALLPDQPEHLAVVLVGRRTTAGWWGAGEVAGWADAVQIARDVATTLRAPLEVRAGVDGPWHPGRCAELVVDGVVIGHAGELHPRVCEASGLPARSAALELDLGPLFAGSLDAAPAPSLSGFPVAKEDVALVVDVAVPAAEVEAALRAGAGGLLESLRLFDVYTGPQVGEGKRSLAYALRLRASDRTLGVDEVSAARDAAVAEAHIRTGAVLRS